MTARMTGARPKWAGTGASRRSVVEVGQDVGEERHRLEPDRVHDKLDVRCPSRGELAQAIGDLRRRTFDRRRACTGAVTHLPATTSGQADVQRAGRLDSAWLTTRCDE